MNQQILKIRRLKRAPEITLTQRGEFDLKKSSHVPKVTQHVGGTFPLLLQILTEPLLALSVGIETC